MLDRSTEEVQRSRFLLSAEREQSSENSLDKQGGSKGGELLEEIVFEVGKSPVQGRVIGTVIGIGHDSRGRIPAGAQILGQERRIRL